MTKQFLIFTLCTAVCGMAATSLGAEMTAVGLQNNLSYSKSDTKNREFYFVFLSACTTFAIKITRF